MALQLGTEMELEMEVWLVMQKAFLILLEQQLLAQQLELQLELQLDMRHK